MRIGVVCEGPTDYPAIVYFFKQALLEQGVDAEFDALYPEMDKTRPDGGWANVLNWLINNPPSSRILKYFGGGLFGGSLAVKPLDAILIHLDTDVLLDRSFENFVNKNYHCTFVVTADPAFRAKQIEDVINKFSRIKEMTCTDGIKHIPAPAVESTEAWCVAAFTAKPSNFENLTGDKLTNCFMKIIEKSEGRHPAFHYTKIDKSLRRRQDFCQKHAVGASRIVASCPQFSVILNKIISLTK